MLNPNCLKVPNKHESVTTKNRACWTYQRLLHALRHSTSFPTDNFVPKAGIVNTNLY